MRLVIAMVLALVASIAILLMLLQVRYFDVNVGVILLALVIAYLSFSFRIVTIGDAAALFVLGEPIGTEDDPASGDVKNGLYFVPYGFCELWIENGTTFQDELPDNPEKIFRGDGSVPEGMFPPIRVKFGQPRADDDDRLKSDPYNIAVTAEIVPIVSWHIQSATTFRKTMRTVENCRKIMADRAVRVFGIEFTDVTPAKASINLESTIERLKRELQVLTNGTGVVIDEAYVKPFIFSHALNAAIQAVFEAVEKAKGTVIEAEALRTKTIKDGDAKATAELALLLKRAIGLKKLAEISGSPEGQMTIWMETMGKAFEKANFSLVPGSDLYSAVGGLSEMLNKLKGEKK